MPAFIKTHYISIVFSTVLLSATAFIYSSSVIGVAVTAVGFALTVVLFLLYDLCNRKQNKWLTCVVSLGVMFSCLGLGAALIYGIDDYNIVKAGMWIFQPRDTDVNKHPQFAFALMFIFGCFFDTAVYYFTAIRYRRLMLFLICLCPFALFAKTFTDIPVIYSILTVICYFLIMFKHNAGVGGRSGDTMTVNDKWYTITAVMFALTVIVIASFFPKPESAPFREQFDRLITGVQFKGVTAEAFGDFADTSSDASSSADENELLYTVSADSPLYLRRQVFDVYNGVEWTYISDDIYNTGYRFNESNACNLAAAAEFLCTLTDDETALEYAQDVKTKQGYAVIRKKYNGGARIVLSVAGTLRLEANGSDTPVYRTIKDEYFTDNARTGNERLSIEYYTNSLSGDYSDYFTEEQVKSLVTLADEKYLANEVTDEDGYNAFKEYYELLTDAQRYYDDCVSVYAGMERVAALAAEITADCDTDYEKALALERYFSNGAFVYDLDYDAPTEGVVYFLFESRRGTCSDFATAMTLMARSVGLSTRYVEGFSMSEITEEGYYAVRVGDSHAFPEIFINGRGWVDFEPTIASTDSGGNEAYVVVIIGTTAVVALVVCLLAVLLLPYFRQLRLRRRYNRADERGKIIIAYGCVSAAICDRLGCAAGTLTAKALSDTLRSRYGIDAAALCDSYNRAVYGGEAVSCGNAPELYKQVKAAISDELRAEKREKRKLRKSGGEI